MLDFRIDTFLAVCKYMNFTKAAEALNITQPAVSQHIRFLEEEYQVKFFDHQGRHLSLTPAGELFRNALTTLKHDDIRLRDKLGGYRNSGGSLVFGATLTIGEYVMPDRIAQYMEAHPDLSIRMVVANTHELLQKLDEGQIDFALVEGFFEKREFDSLVFSHEEYVGVCGRDYSFKGPEPRVVEDLIGERLILREPGSGTREILERYLEARNLSLGDFAPFVEIGSIDAIKSMVLQGRGITFLYERAVREELRDGRLRKIPLTEFGVTHDFTFLWRKDSIFSEDYRALFQNLRG